VSSNWFTLLGPIAAALVTGGTALGVLMLTQRHQALTIRSQHAEDRRRDGAHVAGEAFAFISEASAFNTRDRYVKNPGLEETVRKLRIERCPEVQGLLFVLSAWHPSPDVQVLSRRLALYLPETLPAVENELSKSEVEIALMDASTAHVITYAHAWVYRLFAAVCADSLVQSSDLKPLMARDVLMRSGADPRFAQPWLEDQG
jgi:hypothetical protein